MRTNKNNGIKRIIKKKMPPSHCTHCFKECSGATGFNRQEPKVGDFCMCLYCGNIMKYVKDFTLSNVSEEEVNAYLSNQDKLSIAHFKSKIEKRNRFPE